MKKALCAVLALALFGCGTAMMMNQDNLNKVQTDMSQAEVQSILGTPTESHTEPIPIVGGTQTTFVYRNDANHSMVTIVFKNDMMKEKSGSFNNQ